MDDHCIHVGDVKPCLDNSGGHKHVDIAVYEIAHDPLKLMLPHLPVSVCHRKLRHQLLHVRRDFLDIFHTIIYIIHLPLPGALPLNGLPHHLVIVFHDISLDRHPLSRGLLQDAHIPDPDEAHMERPWNRSRRQRHHIHVIFHLFYLFLVLYAETLLLVNDEQAKVLKFQIISQHPVGSDHDIHKSLFQVLHRLFLLHPRAESAHQIHPHREVTHSLQKRIVMLLRQYRRGHEVHHLLIFLYRLKRRTNGNLRLSVAYVAAYQAVHNLFALHIPLHGFNRMNLVFRFLEGEHFLEFLLPDRILPIHVAFLLLPCGVQFHQIPCNLPDGAPYPGFRPVPLLGSQTVQFWLLCICVGILLYQIKLGRRNIEIAPLSIGNLHIILGNLIHLNLLDSLIDSKPMILMNYVISRFQLGKLLNLPSFV